MKKPNLKERAERNGKIRRTITKIEQTVVKLERMKDEYLEKATAAKVRGDSASYSLAKSGLNATLTQIKRAKEMQLNIEITSELQKMGETNADFLTGMSSIAKSISKINKQSDFVKLQKEISKALSGMEEAQAGLDVFLQNTDAQFAAISQAPGALTDKQIDELVAGKVSEKELLMDEQIDAVMGDVSAQRSAPDIRVGVSGSDNRSVEKKPSENTVAEPFPTPKGTFDFEPRMSKKADMSVLEDSSDIGIPLSGVIKDGGSPKLTIGKCSDGKVAALELCDAPGVIVGGVIGSGKSVFIHQFLTSLIVTHTAKEVKMLLVDLDGEELNRYNGIPHMVCDALCDPAHVMPALDAVEREIDRRYEVLSAAGTRDIASYNAANAAAALPYITVVFDEYSGAMAIPGFERALTRLVRQSQAAGVFFVLATRNVSAAVITPAISAAFAHRIAFKTDAAGAVAIGVDGASDMVGAGSLIYGFGGERTVCAGPYVGEAQIKRAVSAVREDVI